MAIKEWLKKVPREYILGLDWQNIGADVVKKEDFDEEELKAVRTLCERIFKPEDVVLIVKFVDKFSVLPDYAIFTVSSIISVDNQVEEIRYCEIDHVKIEHDSSFGLGYSVGLYQSPGSISPVRIRYGTDVNNDDKCNYLSNMYNFIMDILEYEDGKENTVPEQAPKKIEKAPPSEFDNILSQIEKLAKLKDAGVLSEEEFTEKKGELLARL